MDSSFIQEIAKHIQPEIIEIAGQNHAVYPNGDIKTVGIEKENPYKVLSLDGLLDAANLEESKNSLVEVLSYNSVRLVRRDSQKKVLCIAQSPGVVDLPDSQNPTKMLESLLHVFKGDGADDFSRVYDILSGLKSTSDIEFLDDGISTIVTSSTGVTTRNKTQIKREYWLAPKAGFPETGVPARSYLLRVSKDLQCRLTPHIQPAWEYEASKSIKRYLQDKNPNLLVLA